MQRSKRSVSPKGLDAKRNIEILVVADHLMVKKYGTQEATTYILTVMNMVSGNGFLFDANTSHSGTKL